MTKHKGILIGALIVAGICATRFYSYLLFHTFVEMINIAISTSLFIVAWNSRKYNNNNYITFIGFSFFFISIIDLLHALSYRGLGVFHTFDANLPTQLWIAMRYLFSVTLLVAPFTIHKKLNYSAIFSTYTLITGIILSLIFLGIFPDCYREGYGLTTFKKLSEYIISIIFVASVFCLNKYYRSIDSKTYKLMTASIFASIVAELCFTFYFGVYDFVGMVGHVLLLLSSYLLYVALVETSLVKPYELAIEYRERLKALASELIAVEDRERRRIAVYLHDEIGQLLAFSKMRLGTLHNRETSYESRKIIDEVRASLDDSIKHTRTLTFELSPPILHDLGLEAAIEWLTRDVKEKQGLSVELNIKKDLEIDDQIDGKMSAVLFRAVRELLMNVLKHAHVNFAKININRLDGQIIIEVEDKGRGFDKERQGFGLFNIREQINYLGGEFKLESKIGGGTRATLTAPIGGIYDS